MSFFALLISLLLERFWDGVVSLRYYGWFDGYKSLLNKHLGQQSFWKSYAKLVVLTLPVLAIVYLFYCLFYLIFRDIGAIVFSVIVISYCIGPENLYAQVKKCVIKDDQGKISLAREQVKACFGLDLDIDEHAARLSFSQMVLTIANRRIFAVSFWFALLGPVGAMLYRVIVMCEAEPGTEKEAELIQSILDWPAARLLSFAYAVTGNFMGVFPALMKHLFDGLEKNGMVLQACARAAFGIAEDTAEKNQEIDPLQALHLLDRALGLGLVIVLIFVLIF